MSSIRKLGKCEYCGVIVNATVYGDVCPECTEEDKALFNQARAHLRFGEKVLPEDLANKSGVPLKHIERWVDIGRFGTD